MSKESTLLEMATELADFLEEAHQQEMNTRHHGDVKRSGPAPRNCSYCAAIQRARRVVDQGKNERTKPWQ